MLFLTPRYIKNAKHLQHAAKKLLNYRRDIWSQEQVQTFKSALAHLRQAMRQRNRQAVASASTVIEQLGGQLAPAQPMAGLRENCEVILVAIVIAIGIRAYFLQPFRIPTGSMQPTLFGIVGVPSEQAVPHPVKRLWDLAIHGRAWVDLKATDNVEVVDLKEWSIAGFFTFTDIYTSDGQDRIKKHTLFAPRETLMRYFGVTPGKAFRVGDIIAHGYVDTGDQVFVDKASYQFVRPKLADVFVFKTTGIHGIERFIPAGMGSQYYIKRLAGLPGYTLRIDPPKLFINDKLANPLMMQRVMAAKDGYQGYSNGPAGGRAFPILGSPSSSFTIPQKTYFALGDNSYHSSDSRNWGIVPEDNVTGRGLFVYWPFTSRWGLIR